MEKRFNISTVVEDGYVHYEVVDCQTGNEVHCDTNELNLILYELIGM
jgi:hypothetical protein